MSEPYRVRVTARAARDLELLPEKIAAACLEFVFGALADNPHRVGKPLRRELAGARSARRGDYRVVYALDEGARAIDVLHIARRSDVYRRP